MLHRLPLKVVRHSVALLSTTSKKKRAVFDPDRFCQPGEVPKDLTKFPSVHPDPEEDYYKRRFYPKLKENVEEEEALGGWRKRGNSENYGRSFRETNRTRDEFIARCDLGVIEDGVV